MSQTMLSDEIIEPNRITFAEFDRQYFTDLARALQESVLRNQAMRNLIDRAPMPDAIVEAPNADQL